MQDGGVAFLEVVDRAARFLVATFSLVEPNNKTKLENDLTWAGIDLQHFRPDQALVFWLQGFSSNPLNPILSINGKQIVNNMEVGNPVPRTNAFFEFDKTRLAGYAIDTSLTGLPNPAPSYFPAGTKLTTSHDESFWRVRRLFPSGRPAVRQFCIGTRRLTNSWLRY